MMSEETSSPIQNIDRNLFTVCMFIDLPPKGIKEPIYVGILFTLHNFILRLLSYYTLVSVQSTP